MQPFHRLDRALEILRIQAGLRQIDIARRAEITAAMISEYEAGKKRPHVDTLGKILTVLGADAHALANALRTAQREEIEQPLPEGATSGDEARRRATRALGEMTTAFDTLSRALTDLLLPAPAAGSDVDAGAALPPNQPRASSADTNRAPASSA